MGGWGEWGCGVTGLTCHPTATTYPDCVGETFQAVRNASSASKVDVKLESASTDPSGSGFILYKVKYFDPASPSSGWLDYCGPGGTNKAVVLMGTWDKEAKFSPSPSGNPFSFACIDTAAGKCQRDPKLYNTTLSDTLPSDYFQACTRMLRADYCGDGKSHTVTGRPISVKDKLGRNAGWDHVPDGRPWVYETGWGRDGANCVRGDARAPTKPFDCASKLLSVGENCRNHNKLWPGGVLMQTLTSSPILDLNPDLDADYCRTPGACL
jgi:hypothetical protein